MSHRKVRPAKGPSQKPGQRPQAKKRAELLIKTRSLTLIAIVLAMGGIALYQSEIREEAPTAENNKSKTPKPAEKSDIQIAREAVRKMQAFLIENPVKMPTGISQRPARQEEISTVLSEGILPAEKAVHDMLESDPRLKAAILRELLPSIKAHLGKETNIESIIVQVAKRAIAMDLNIRSVLKTMSTEGGKNAMIRTINRAIIPEGYLIVRRVTKEGESEPDTAAPFKIDRFFILSIEYDEQEHHFLLMEKDSMEMAGLLGEVGTVAESGAITSSSLCGAVLMGKRSGYGGLNEAEHLLDMKLNDRLEPDRRLFRAEQLFDEEDRKLIDGQTDMIHEALLEELSSAGLEIRLLASQAPEAAIDSLENICKLFNHPQIQQYRLVFDFLTVMLFGEKKASVEKNPIQAQNRFTELKKTGFFTREILAAIGESMYAFGEKGKRKMRKSG